MEIELIDRPFEIMSVNNTTGTFKGMASIFGSMVEAWMPTVFARGAFLKTIRENGKRFRILFQHDVNEPLARPGLKVNSADLLEETPQGLLVGAKISQTAKGRDVMVLLKDQVLDELSVGWDPIKEERMPLNQVVAQGLLLNPEQFSGWNHNEPIRVIREARLWECSIVVWGADPLTYLEAASRRYTPTPDPVDVRAQNRRRLEQLAEAQRFFDSYR